MEEKNSRREEEKPEKQEKQMQEEEKQKEEEEEVYGPSDKEGAAQIQLSQGGLSDGEKSVLSTVFQLNIESGRVMPIAEFRAKMKTDLFLRKHLLDAHKTKKMQDFGRHKTEVVGASALDDLPSGANPIDEWKVPTLQEVFSTKTRSTTL